MDDNKVKEILDDPQKMFNLFRLVHQLLHAYDEKERRKLETASVAGLGDTLSIVLKRDGEIKESITNQKL